MKDKKLWNVMGWISFVFFIITVVIYFFVDENYVESPTWLVAAVACWFYRDYLEKEQNSTSG
jgi:hypothetical protein